MKRRTYVDSAGNEINQTLEQRRPLLKLFFIVGTVVPLIMMGMIIYKVAENNKCITVYNNVKTATKQYLENRNNFPKIEGESTTVSISKLYRDTLNSTSTLNIMASGNVKVTKYKENYVYTIELKNCSVCSTDKRYSSYSNEQNNYPNKQIVDVIPYYNYYNRQQNVTNFSNYFEEDELSDEVSEYGIKLPLDKEKLPEIPKEGTITNIESESTYYYRYREKTWKWYDIIGDYSDYSSEKPDGYRNKDENTENYTNWSEYTLNYPEEKSYREIQKETGYKFYYENENGKKIYYNDGNYADKDEVNTEKYNKTDDETAPIYRYRDKVWRWYNGNKRTYSRYHATSPEGMPYKDEATEILGSPTSWSEESYVDSSNSEYRVEEKKPMTRFRIDYEFLTLKAFETPLKKEEFEAKVGQSLEEFSKREDVKLEVTYKFRYRKAK